VFLRHGDKGFVVGFLVTHEGGVGFDDDFVFVAVVDYCTLLAPGVELRCTIISTSFKPCGPGDGNECGTGGESGGIPQSDSPAAAKSSHNSAFPQYATPQNC